jgi:hypothetical protein
MALLSVLFPDARHLLCLSEEIIRPEEESRGERLLEARRKVEAEVKGESVGGVRCNVGGRRLEERS